MAPHRSQVTQERESFWHLVHAEWTKFRTVRGWVIAVLVTIVAITAFVFVSTDVSSGCTAVQGASSAATAAACPAQPTGPGGDPVQDVFYFAHQPVTGNGTITVQMTSLTGQTPVAPAGVVPDGGQAGPGLQPWSKAGIIIKENTSQGSAYAAMMVTGSNGVRMQWDYVNDTPGLAGRVSASSPRWLRLARDGGTINGYDSADGTHWTLVGTAALPRLTSTVQAGLFAAGSSDDSDLGTLATGVFRHIGLSWPATGWTGTSVGGAGPNSGVPAPGTLRQSAGSITVAGFGDIGPAAGNMYSGNGQSLQRALAGTFFGLIPLIVVAAMFITAEYRRGLIRVSLTAAPRRGRLLAAKAVVIGAAGFVAGLAGATLALAVGTPLLLRAGPLQWPVSLLTEARMVVGTAVLLAVAAVLALAIGTIVRRSAPAVAIVIVVIFVPWLLAFGPLAGQGGGAGGWELQVTPLAALSVQQAVPQFHQLITIYSLDNGYYPLAPWAGLAVECAWAAAALALAFLPAAPQRRMSLTARVAPPRYLLGQALHAEWTKFRTVAGPSWLLAGVVALTVAVGVAAASAARCQSATCGIDPATVSFTGIYPAQAVAAVAGVLAIGNEYSTGMIKLSLTAMPRRLTWFFAKATVLTAPVLTASALAVAGAALAGRLILPGHGFTPAHGYASLTSATDLRAAVGAVLYLTLIALLSLGLAAAVRDSAAAIGVVLGVLYLFPLAADVISNPALARHLDQIGPLPAGLDAQATTGVKGLPLTPWQGLGVVALWTAGALLLGALALKSRDA